MGIQGLLPLLKPIHKEVNLSQFAGQTIGVDTYCWLHKGAYGCAMDIVEGKKTQMYLNYVIKRLDMMIYHNVKPYLVLDGGHLPSKANKEAERRKSRQDNKAKGLAFLRAGNKSQAHECFQKCVDITPEMALDVIKVCRERNIDYIVAPYEADSQLAYLMKTGITQAIISEDSDLLVYGCNKVIFKMDEFGSGTLVDLADLPKLKDLKMYEFTLEKFRHMCILSGCDYLPSIKGIGLKTANKLIRKHPTIERLVRSIRLENKLKVPLDYEKNFKQADETFLYQLVFDPNTLSLVPLTPLPDGVLPGQLEFAGPLLANDKAHAIAVGNINPITHQLMDTYDPNNKEVEKPNENKADTPVCALRFSNKNTSRQSLTPSTLMNNNHSSKNRTETRNTVVDKCRRFLLPPVDNLSKEKYVSDDKDIMKMYTFLKPKPSTTDKLKQNRVSTQGCGLLRKRKIKNPFRMDYNDDTMAEQQSSYFSSTDDNTGVDCKETINNTNIMDCNESTNNMATTSKVPPLPTWKHLEHQTPAEDSEDHKENSPINSASFEFPLRSSSPGKVLFKALSINDRISDLIMECKEPNKSYSNNGNDRPLSSTTKHFKIMPAPQETPIVPTPLRGLNKFVYKPKGRDVVGEEKEITLKSVSRDDEVIDSGYLSDGEESTDADTPTREKDKDTQSREKDDSQTRGEYNNTRSIENENCSQSREKCSHTQSRENDNGSLYSKKHDKVVNGPIRRPIQLKSTGTVKRTGLGRCKSLGISKRKSSTIKPAVSGTSTLFSYFEYKNKRPRLDTS